MRAVLVRGEPAIDAPNVARLERLDPDLELCKDLATYERPQYHPYGQALDCTGAFTWQSDSINVLGDFGTFTAIGPVVIDTLYVAYRKGGTQVGWVQVSFILNNSLSVSLQIHRVLEYCNSTGTGELADGTTMLVPNPTDGTEIRVEGPGELRSITVFDATGREVFRHRGTQRTLPAPDHAGSYVVRFEHLDGHWTTARLLRY
jgi:hypothetical protein